jgi:hypothetical protein
LGTLSCSRFPEIGIPINARGPRSIYYRFTPEQKLFLVKGFLAFDTVKGFHEKILVPRAKKCFEDGTDPSRLDVMTVPEAEKLARLWEVNHGVRQGQEDFAQALEYMLRKQADGATIAFKEAGNSVNHPRSILSDSLKAFLKDDDLFIFLMTALQKRLLAKYGKVVAADGTHCVLSYGAIKLIVVLVTSFTSANDNVKDKGFPLLAR